MRSCDEIDYVQLEEQLNLLSMDPEVRRRRTGVMDFIMARLRERINRKLGKLGLDDMLEQDFRRLASGKDRQCVKEHAYFQTVVQQDLKLSARQLSEFRKCAAVDPSAAVDIMKQHLLEKEILDFQKNCGIAPASWKRFREAYTYISEKDVRLIERGFADPQKMLSIRDQYISEKKLVAVCKELSLTSEEKRELRNLFILNSFTVTAAFRTEVGDCRTNTRLPDGTAPGVSDFLIYARIGRDAWEAFYASGSNNEPSAPKRTSQETLLKLVVGFGMCESCAKRFLEKIGSGFFMRRDLVVLSAIRCGWNQPILMEDILRFFSTGPHGEEYYYYGSLYRD